MTPLLLVAVGVIAGYVYARAVQSVACRAEALSRPIPNPRAILADCDTCGRTIQDRHGRCSSCGSSSIWTLGVAVPEPSDVQVSATLARVAFLADVKGRAVARNERARGGLTSGRVQ